MRGLDPRIHHVRKIHTKQMDPRVKPAGDGSALFVAQTAGPRSLANSTKTTHSASDTVVEETCK